MAAKKRAPGGGRKPVGDKAKAANFSTRITPDTRAQLDAVAAATGKSVSQVAERMLQLGLDVASERQIDDPIRALAHLLRLLSRHCNYVYPDEWREWHSDPFAFDAFARAIQMLLEQIRPAGEIKAPGEMTYPGIPTWPTSQKQAEVAAATVWREVTTEAPMSPTEIRERVNKRGPVHEMAEQRGFRLDDWPEDLIGRISRRSLALDSVRRTFGIKREAKKS